MPQNKPRSPVRSIRSAFPSAGAQRKSFGSVAAHYAECYLGQDEVDRILRLQQTNDSPARAERDDPQQRKASAQPGVFGWLDRLRSAG